MKTIKILTAITAMFFIFAVNTEAQNKSTLYQEYLYIEVPSGPHAGELYEGIVTLTVATEVRSKSSSTTVAYMNKAELVSSTSNNSGLTKADPKSSLSSHALLVNWTKAENQIILIFDDGTSCDVSYALEIKELIIRATIFTPDKKKSK